jgi:hypothetical protein
MGVRIEAFPFHFGTGNVAPAREAHFLSSECLGLPSNVETMQRKIRRSQPVAVRGQRYRRPQLASGDDGQLRIKHEHDAKPRWLAAAPCAQCMLSNKLRSAANNLSAATRTSYDNPTSRRSSSRVSLYQKHTHLDAPLQYSVDQSRAQQS